MRYFLSNLNEKYEKEIYINSFLNLKEDLKEKV